MSPTQRSLAWLRRRGCLAESVERYVKTPQGGFRRDLFHFADIAALEPDRPGVLFVQACRTDDQATRLAKIRSAKVWPNVERVLAAGNRVRVMGWQMRGAAGTRKRYTLSVTEVTT